MNLGRRSTSEPAGTTAVDDEIVEPAGKGRPTPKRSESRKARRNVTPTNRKEAAALQREKAREQRKVARNALVTGDERNLPPRDAGPERRLARDIVDSRLCAGQFLFPLMFVSLLISVVAGKTPIIPFVFEILALVALTVMVIDSQRIGRLAKVAVISKFGEAEARGISSYAFMRAWLPRRFRKPPPKVNRGDAVRS